MPGRTHRFTTGRQVQTAVGIKNTLVDVTVYWPVITMTGRVETKTKSMLLRLEDWPVDALEELLNATNTAIDRKLALMPDQEALL